MRHGHATEAKTLLERADGKARRNSVIRTAAELHWFSGDVSWDWLSGGSFSKLNHSPRMPTNKWRGCLQNWRAGLRPSATL